MATMRSTIGTAVVSVVFALACTEGGAGDTGPYSIPNGGGTSGSGGAAHGSAGSAGSAGVDSTGNAGNAGNSADSGGSGGSRQVDTPDSGSARFRATLQGEAVGVSALDVVWMRACENSLRVVQRSGDNWAPLRDERPDGFNLQWAAHYLDGVYHSDCHLSLGCDVDSCEPLRENQDAFLVFGVPLVAREYVQVGERAAPSCDAEDAGTQTDAGLRRVPDIESHAATGPLGVRVRYYLDARCEAPALTADVAVQ